MYKIKYVEKFPHILLLFLLVISSIFFNSELFLKSSNNPIDKPVKKPDLIDSIKPINNPLVKTDNNPSLLVQKSQNQMQLQPHAVAKTQIDSIQSLNSYPTLYSITINGNSQFNASGSKFTGTGTKANPFTLQYYNFQPNYPSIGSIAISISNTNAYFVINGNYLSYASGYFVNFNNVTNGIVVNNTISNTFDPFYITGPSSHISIINNTIIGTTTKGTGISIVSTTGSITVLNNTIENFQYYGLLFQDGGSNNIIENNTITGNLEEGIFIGGTTSSSTIGTYNSTIKNNILTNNYIYFETDYYYTTTRIDQFSVSNNFVNNRPIDFFQNVMNPSFSSYPSEIVVFNSTNVSVKNIPTMSGPFIIAKSKNILVKNVTIANSVNNGMDLYNDANIVVTNNIIKNDSLYGINLYSTNATVTNNTIDGRLVYSYLGRYTSSFDGILLGTVAVSSNISFNIISNFDVGIYAWPNNITVNGNIIKNVTTYALYLAYATTFHSISNNLFYNNSLTLGNFYTQFPFTNNSFNDAPIKIYNGLQNQVLAPNGTIPSVYGQLYIENSNFITLKNLTSNYDINLYNCNNITLINSKILTNGLTIQAAANVTVKNNIIHGLYGNGFHISSTSTSVKNVLIQNNTILGNNYNPSDGMFITGLNNSLVTNNTILDFTYGIDVSGDINTTISNNSINFIDATKPGYSGIYVTGLPAKRNKIENNSIQHFSYGMYLDYQITFNSFFDNYITQCGYGVYDNQATNNSIYSNIFNNDSYGFYLNYAHFTAVSNNIIENNIWGGYVYSSSANDIITGNNFFNSTYIGLYIDATSNNNTIMNNIFLNNTQEGLKVYSVNNTISLNDFVNNNQSTVSNHRIQVYITSTKNIIIQNYYSDSLHYDFNWDGIVDTPYTNFGSKAVDNFPKTDPIHLPYTNEPMIFISPANNSNFGSAGFLLQYNISERSITVIYINNNANITDIPSGTNMSYLGDGTYNITIKVTDLSGNVGIVSISVVIKTLSISIINPTNTTYNSLSLQVSYFIVASSTYSLKVYINGNLNTSAIANNTFISFSEGYNNLTLVIIEQGHNVISTVFFTIDTIPPNVIIFSPSNSTFTSNTIMISYSISDYSKITTLIYIDGKVNTTNINSNSYLILTNGYHNITFVVSDIFNQITIKSVYFTILKVTPLITINSPTNSTLTSNTVSIDYTITEADQYTTKIIIDGQTNSTAINSGSTLDLNTGVHNITISVVDIAGNSAVKTIVFTIVTTSSNISLSTTMASTTASSNSGTSNSSGSSNSSTETGTKTSPLGIDSILIAFLLLASMKVIFLNRRKNK